MTGESCYPNFYISLPAIEIFIGLIVAGHNVDLFALAVVGLVFRSQKKIKALSQLKPGQNCSELLSFHTV